jgi:parallel beta-helix repeat protein
LNDTLLGAGIDISEIQSGATTCLKIDASDIVLDGNGFNLSRNGAGGLTWGIAANSSGYSNLTIKNMNVQSYEVGINLVNINYSVLFNNSVINTVNTPISLNTVYNSNVTFNNVTNAAYSSNRGINLGVSGAGENNSINNNFVTRGYGGIYLVNHARSNITNNSVLDFNYDGISISVASNISIKNNNASASNYAILGSLSSDSRIENNYIYGAPSYGAYLYSGVTNFVIANNNFTLANSYGFRCDGCTQTNLTSNYITSGGSGSIGTWLVGGSNNYIFNNTYDAYTYYTIAVEGSTDNSIDSNNLTVSGGNGLGIISGSSNNNISNNYVTGGQYNYYFYGSSNLYIFNNSARTASGINYYCYNSNSVIFNKNNASDSSTGVYLSSCYSSTINSLDVSQITQYGLSLDSSSSSIIENSTFHDNSLYGVYITSSIGSILRNNTAYNNFYGFYLIGTLGSNDAKQLINNTAYNNQYGAYFQYTTNDLVLNNSFYNNTQIGLSSQDNRNLTIQENQIYNNTIGSRFYGATFSSYNGSYNFDHFYNNPIDLKLQSNGGNTLFYSLNGVIFDSPLGTFRNYTNLTINDTVGGGVTYTISWSGGNTTTPANTSLFNNKTINISTISGSPTIDLIQWKWTAAEATGYNESNLTIYSYVNGWVKKDAILNASAHTLTLTTLSSPDAIYAILDDENPHGGGGGSTTEVLIGAATFAFGAGAYIIYRRFFRSR